MHRPNAYYLDSPSENNSKTTEDVFERALLCAPVDDEPEMPGERAAVEEALRDIREGRTVSHEEAKRRLGLA
jgi:hypothetical protein